MCLYYIIFFENQEMKHMHADFKISKYASVADHNYSLDTCCICDRICKKVPFSHTNLTHFLNFINSSLFNHCIHLCAIFYRYSYSIWLHFDTKVTQPLKGSQLLQHFVCQCVKCVERYVFTNHIFY